YFGNSIAANNNVFRLEIAVNNFLRVRFSKPSQNLVDNVQPVIERNPLRASQQGTESFAFNVFHGDGDHVSETVEIVHAANVFVSNFSSEYHFTFKAFNLSGFDGYCRMQFFYCEDSSSFAIAYLINTTHTAAAEAGQDLVSVTNGALRF